MRYEGRGIFYCENLDCPVIRVHAKNSHINDVKLDPTIKVDPTKYEKILMLAKIKEIPRG